MIRDEAEALISLQERQNGQTDRLLALRRMIRPLDWMERFLNGSVDSQAFKIGFSREWSTLRIGRQHGPGVEGLRVGFQAFYELIHFFSPYPDRRAEEPLLFDEEQLYRRTREAFDLLKDEWFEQARATPD